MISIILPALLLTDCMFHENILKSKSNILFMTALFVSFEMFTIFKFLVRFLHTFYQIYCFDKFNYLYWIEILNIFHIDGQPNYKKYLNCPRIK